MMVSIQKKKTVDLPGSRLMCGTEPEGTLGRRNANRNGMSRLKWKQVEG